MPEAGGAAEPVSWEGSSAFTQLRLLRGTMSGRQSAAGIRVAVAASASSIKLLARFLPPTLGDAIAFSLAVTNPTLRAKAGLAEIWAGGSVAEATVRPPATAALGGAEAEARAAAGMRAGAAAGRPVTLVAG